MRDFTYIHGFDWILRTLVSNFVEAEILDHGDDISGQKCLWKSLERKLEGLDSCETQNDSARWLMDSQQFTLEELIIIKLVPSYYNFVINLVIKIVINWLI
jgi:hypothetical protein